MKLERQFEKELAGDLRQETASKLQEARKKPANFKELKQEIENKKELPQDYESWNSVKEGFEILKKNIIGKIFKTEKYREQEYLLSEILKTKKEASIKEIQEEYQEKFNKILEDCPLSKAEREKYLSTESMEKMSLDDYLTLLKRLSGEAFYHVTRYGVRENTFMSTGGGHTEGKGNFINSFNPLLKDGNINSFVSSITRDSSRAKSLLDDNKEAIEKLKKEGKPTEKIVDEIMGSLGSMYFLDRESTHFSYGKDLHRMYGGEKDYKFYFYYPVEYILQNDFFQKTRETQINIGQGYYHNRGGIDQQYNDIEIFNFGKGVPTEAGILCITGDIKVDPETGSQYLLKNGKPEIDENGEFKKPEKTISSKEYWESYFKIHPELKPNKIIYGEFSTSTYKSDPELEKWAESKNIFRQNQEKTNEFKEYAKINRDIIRKIFTNILQENYTDQEKIK